MSIKFRDLNVTINVQPNEAKKVEKERYNSLLPTQLPIISTFSLCDELEKHISQLLDGLPRPDFSLCDESEKQKGAEKGCYHKTNAPDGVYIAMSNDFCVKPEFWGLYKEQKDKVVGCAIIEGGKRILIAPDESEDDLEYASECNEIPGLKTLDRDNAKEDWDGSYNTSRLLSHAKSEAAMYCKKYGILNRVAGTWHLPALAEMIFAQKYIDRVNACLTLSDKTPIKFTDWYWSSSQSSGTDAWMLYWSDGAVTNTNKTNSTRVRAFAAL